MATSRYRVFGNVDENAVSQLETCLQHPLAVAGALMADGHKGYSMPIGGVVAYDNAVSPSGVGFDIACGNKAVKLDMKIDALALGGLKMVMDEIWNVLSFGIGLKNKERVDHDMFYSPEWDDLDEIHHLEELARSQLGTIGSGNHYVDLFHDEAGHIWIGVHFGSRGFGHKIASGYMNLSKGSQFTDRYHDQMDVPAIVFDLDEELGQRYWTAMSLAGDYAYAGRDWVCQRVADIIGAKITYEVHNHHNFAWIENHPSVGDVVVVRKGATPAWPGQEGFVGSTMSEKSVILIGSGWDRHDIVEEQEDSLYSTVHGAGRVMSRMKAKGKPKKGKPGLVDWPVTRIEVKNKGVILKGGGADEAPQCYKRLDEVLEHQGGTVEVLERLTPIGVAMAGEDEFDPYKD